MAGRQLKQKPVKGSAILVSLGLVALWLAAPAIASFDSVSACSDLTEPRLQLSTTDLKAAVSPPDVDAIDVNSSEDSAERIEPTRFLSPGTDVAAPGELDQSPTPLANEEERPPMNARVPGVSDEALSRYKRQMYRKDI